MSRLEEIVTDLLKQRWTFLGELAEHIYKIPEHYKDQKEDYQNLPFMWVKAPHFLGVIVINLDQKIVATSPILGTWKNKSVDDFILYCKYQKYELGML